MSSTNCLIVSYPRELEARLPVTEGEIWDKIKELGGQLSYYSAELPGIGRDRALIKVSKLSEKQIAQLKFQLDMDLKIVEVTATEREPRT